MSAISLYAKTTEGFETRVASALALLTEAAAAHPGSIVQATSLGAEDMVITDLIARRYLDHDKRIFVLLFLLLTPFYQFHGQRFASNQTLLSLAVSEGEVSGIGSENTVGTLTCMGYFQSLKNAANEKFEVTSGGTLAA